MSKIQQACNCIHVTETFIQTCWDDVNWCLDWMRKWKKKGTKVLKRPRVKWREGRKRVSTRTDTLGLNIGLQISTGPCGILGCSRCSNTQTHTSYDTKLFSKRKLANLHPHNFSSSHKISVRCCNVYTGKLMQTKSTSFIYQLINLHVSNKHTPCPHLSTWPKVSWDLRETRNKQYFRNY